MTQSFNHSQQQVAEVPSIKSEALRVVEAWKYLLKQSAVFFLRQHLTQYSSVICVHR